MHVLKSIGILLSRLSIAAIFLFSGVNKILDFEGTKGFMATKNLEMIPLLLVLAIGAELIGGLLLVLGYRTRLAALMLIVFLGAATYFFHDFWNLEGLQMQRQQIMFFKNLAIFGGLVMLLSVGPGSASVDGADDQG